jgi:nucleoside-diphosphate-sugar epimerase
MYKTCVQDGRIVINNASLWRPVLDLRDAVAAYLRAIQADYGISGVFNVASDNYTVGQMGDMVKDQMERLLGRRIDIEIKHIDDLRNYKVQIGRARTVLGFEPTRDVTDIIEDLHEHRDRYGDLDNDMYYNIRVFRGLVAGTSGE